MRRGFERAARLYAWMKDAFTDTNSYNTQAPISGAHENEVIYMTDALLEDVSVRDYMSDEYKTGKPGDTLADAMGIMRKHELTELPITEGDDLVGLVSYAILTRRRKLPFTTLVENIMVTPPRLEPDTAVTKAAEALMLSDFRMVPVTERGKIVGMISRSDIIHVLKDHPDIVSESIESIMDPMKLFIYESDAVSKALHRMKELDERTTPVLDENDRLVGILSIRELSGLLTEPRDKASRGERSGEKTSPNIEVKSLMTTPPISIDKDTSPADVVSLMLDHEISTVPVKNEEGELIGVISQHNLIEQIAKHQEREECFVELAGLEIEDPRIYDAIYSIIQKYLNRINNMFRPRTLQIHVEHHHHEYDLYKYTLRARLNTKKKLYVSKSYDWEIIKAADELMSNLEKQIRKDHEKWRDISRMRQRQQKPM